MAVRVGRPLPLVEFAELHVERAGRHLDLGVADRLAEEVIALQLDLDLFLGQVEGLVGLHGDLELGQDVALDRHGLVGPVFADEARTW